MTNKRTRTFRTSRQSLRKRQNDIPRNRRASSKEEARIFGSTTIDINNKRASDHTTKIYKALLTLAVCLASFALLQQVISTEAVSEIPETPVQENSPALLLPDDPPPDVFIFPEKKVSV